MDEIIRAVSKDGFVKISVVTARDAVQRANAIHHCSPTAIAALGRSLCAASMLGDLLKEENVTLTLRISGGGGLGMSLRRGRQAGDALRFGRTTVGDVVGLDQLALQVLNVLGLHGVRPIDPAKIGVPDRGPRQAPRRPRGAKDSIES